MKPFNQLLRHKKESMSFRKDVILDIMGSRPRTVCELLDTCVMAELGSQATIHRELHELMDKKFIISRIDSKDSRVINLAISASGKRYLEAL